MTMKRNVLILVVSLLSMVSQVANAQCVVKGAHPINQGD